MECIHEKHGALKLTYAKNKNKTKNRDTVKINVLTPYLCGSNAGGRSFLCFLLVCVYVSVYVCVCERRGGWGGHIVNNGIVIHHLIMI